MPPFIDCVFWQQLAKWHVDLPGENAHVPHRRTLVETQVEPGDVIFVKTDLLDSFCRYKLPVITQPFVLITGQSDLEPSQFARQTLEASRQLIRWHAVHVSTESHKCFAIPLGVIDYHGQDKLLDLALKLETDNQTRVHRAWLPPCNLDVHPVRRECADLSHPLLDNSAASGTRMSHDDYLERMTQYEYVVSPLGNGNESSRTYEAMVMGAIPIFVTDGHGRVPAAFRYFDVVVVQGQQGLKDFLDTLPPPTQSHHNTHLLLEDSAWQTWISDGKI